MRVSTSFPFTRVTCRCTYLFDVVGVAVSVGMIIFRAVRRTVLVSSVERVRRRVWTKNVQRGNGSLFRFIGGLNFDDGVVRSFD